MEKEIKKIPRQRFLTLGLAFTSLLAVPSFLWFKKKKEPQTVKMLTQDGRLVEIEVKNIPQQKKKIRDAELHTWVNKKNSL